MVSVAQMVERLVVDQLVASSNLVGHPHLAGSGILRLGQARLGLDDSGVVRFGLSERSVTR